jgi:hypothetical protein
MSKNDAEEIVYRFFRRSFLSLWSYANPRGKHAGKELCDTLVVCAPDVVIVSVKASNLTQAGDVETNATRWRKRAIDESLKQIYGAERWVRTAPQVIRSDGSPGLPLPSPRRIHRVAVAAGGGRQMPIESHDFGKGFVHVFDEASFAAVLGELDTVTDFIAYLTAKEELYRSGVEMTFDGGEEDLLAVYLHRGRKFPPEFKGRGRLRRELWNDLTSKAEYRAKKIEDRISYAWDGIVDHVAEQALAGRLEFGPSLTNAELSLRVMAREDRFARRCLAKSFLEFIQRSNEIESRMVVSPSGVAYVFLAKPHGTDRQSRCSELSLRCFIARAQNEGRGEVVVGIATERYDPSRPGFSIDLCCLSKPKWTAEDQRVVEAMQKDLGYFAAPVTTAVQEDEYPHS